MRGVALAVALTLATSHAAAEDADQAEAPAAPPAFAVVTLGQELALLVHADGGTQDLHVPLFRAEEEIGWHFGGAASGAGLSLQLAEVTGSYLDYRIVGFQVGAAFRYDAPVAAGVTVGPVVKLGYALLVDARGSEPVSHAFAPLAGCEVRMLLGGRGVLTFRPAALDWVVNDNGAVMGAQALAGGGVAF